MTPAAQLLILESLHDEHDRKARRLEAVGSGTENRFAADALRWAIDQLTEPTTAAMWTAHCHVCEANWNAEGEHNPFPRGCFCPDCRAEKRSAPGILNWTPW